MTTNKRVSKGYCNSLRAKDATKRLTEGYCNSIKHYKYKQPQYKHELLRSIVKKNVANKRKKAMSPFFESFFKLPDSEKCFNLKEPIDIVPRDILEKGSSTIRHNEYKYIYNIKEGYFGNENDSKIIDKHDFEASDNLTLCLFVVPIDTDRSADYERCCDDLKKKKFTPKVRIVNYHYEMPE